MALWSRGTNESAASSSWLNVSRSVHELFCSVQNFGMKLSWSWFSGFLLTYATAVNFDLLHSTTDWCTDICADCKKFHKFLLSLGQWNIYWSAGIHGAQRIYPNDIGDLQIFYLLPTSRLTIVADQNVLKTFRHVLLFCPNSSICPNHIPIDLHQPQLYFVLQ